MRPDTIQPTDQEIPQTDVELVEAIKRRHKDKYRDSYRQKIQKVIDSRVDILTDEDIDKYLEEEKKKEKQKEALQKVGEFRRGFNEARMWSKQLGLFGLLRNQMGM